MRLKAGENLSCLNFLNPKVGEYLTFMEELSALRRHTVSEVENRFQQSSWWWWMMEMLIVNVYSMEQIVKQKMSGCCWQEQEHPGLGALQRWSRQVRHLLSATVLVKLFFFCIWRDTSMIAYFGWKFSSMCLNTKIILSSRTGVTILSDILRYCADHNIDIDIPKVTQISFTLCWIFEITLSPNQVLSHLRQQRMLMVQTVAQVPLI